MGLLLGEKFVGSIQNDILCIISYFSCCYRVLTNSRNPMQSVLLKNTLGTILDKGPVIVTESDSYLGESLLETTVMQVNFFYYKIIFIILALKG